MTTTRSAIPPSDFGRLGAMTTKPTPKTSPENPMRNVFRFLSALFASALVTMRRAFTSAPLVVAGEDDDIEALMEAAEAEVGGLLDVAGDEAPAGRAGLQRQSRELVKRRPLGFPAYSLAAVNDTTTITATAKRGIRINRLLLSSNIAGTVVMDSFKMGDIEQLLTRGVPIELYGSSALVDSVPDNFDAVAANTEVSIELRLVSLAGQTDPITGTVGAKCAVLSTGA
jgi:hypothetical protein